MAALKPVRLSGSAEQVRPAPVPVPSVLTLSRAAARWAGFSMRDRIELHRWSNRASGFGVSRVRLEPAEPEDAPGMGEFLLVYMDGEEWARWGVARRQDGVVEVWSMTDGSSLGCYTTLVEALQRILAV